MLADLLGFGGGGGTEVNVTQTQQVSQNVNVGGGLDQGTILIIAIAAVGYAVLS